MDIEAIGRDFEAQHADKKTEIVEINEHNELAQSSESGLSAIDVVGETQQEILTRAKKKIKSDKSLEKHADRIAKITDKAIKVDTERADLKVKKQDADNKVEKQEIKNRLLILKAEAERLKKEQRQLDREQKADHKARNKARKWELYSGKLGKMGYDYVPNVVILSMLLFFDGVKSFIDGLGTISTAIVKALKWVLLGGAILIVLFSIPVTRNWIINILSS